jgi:hypothetical protein
VSGAPDLASETWESPKIKLGKYCSLKTPIATESILDFRQIAIPRVDHNYSGEGLLNMSVQSG